MEVVDELTALNATGLSITWLDCVTAAVGSGEPGVLEVKVKAAPVTEGSVDTALTAR